MRRKNGPPVRNSFDCAQTATTRPHFSAGAALSATPADAKMPRNQRAMETYTQVHVTIIIRALGFESRRCCFRSLVVTSGYGEACCVSRPRPGGKLLQSSKSSYHWLTGPFAFHSMPW